MIWTTASHNDRSTRTTVAYAGRTSRHVLRHLGTVS